MKFYLKTLLLLALTTQVAIGQNDCNAFYPFTEGSTAQITTYNKRGKVAAVSDYTVKTVSNSTGNSVATMATQVSDKRGDVISEAEFNVTCDNESVAIDFTSLMNAEMLSPYRDMNTEFTGTDLVLPNNLSVGQELPDANMNVKIDMSGFEMNMNFAMIDREVIAQESVTTPAGTFDCYVISYSTRLEMAMNRLGSAKQWVARGVGMVKQEDYNRSGNVTSSSLLTAFNQ